MNSTVKKLLLIRGLRSFGQGMMIVDLTLYMAALGWSGAAIGGVLTASSLFSACLIILVGMMSDRIGRRPFLLLAEILTLLSAGGAAFTHNPIFLSAAVIFANFGRGQTGSAGPFAPAEQAWLARLVPQRRRGRIFSYNTAIGFFGMGLGAFFGGLPAWLKPYFNEVEAYIPVFIIIFVLSIICLAVTLTLQEPKNPVELKPALEEEERKRIDEIEKSKLKKENRKLMKLAFVNIINGTAIGLISPLIAYWFAVKFGVGTALIGLTLSLSFLLTSGASLINGWLTEKLGIIRSVVWLRLAGFVLLLILPFAPHFWLASVIYIFRSALNRGTQGARAAVSTSLTRDKRRGFATSISAFSMRVPASAGPAVSGAMLDAGFLVMPFLAASGLQLLYVILYGQFFKDLDRGVKRLNPKKRQN